MRKTMICTLLAAVLSFSLQGNGRSSGKETSPSHHDETYMAASASELSDDTSGALEQAAIGTTSSSEEREFAKRYFTHLVDNKITNNLGNCGYTAIGMYLSFLDTYWNDAIIPEKYESAFTSLTSSDFQDSYDPSDYPSPGIKDTFQYSPSIGELEKNLIRQGISVSDKKDPTYMAAMDLLIMPYVKKEMDDDTFLGYLFKLGIDAGVITPHFTLDSYTAFGETGTDKEMVVANPNGYQYSLTVNCETISVIIEKYFEENRQIKKLFTVHHEYLNLNQANFGEIRIMRSKVVNLLKQGHTLLLSGDGYGSKSEFSHAAIGYDYIQKEDKEWAIFGNLGTDSQMVYSDFDETFNIGFSGYWYIDFNSDFPRSYTDKYFFTDWNQFYSPYENAHVSHPITPSDYGFADAYPTDDDTRNVGVQHTVPGEELRFTTKRYRTGYIQQHSVVMSCIRTGITEAYIEYEFENPIYGVIVNMSYWREFDYDLLDATTGRAGLRIFGYQDPNSQYDSGGWIQHYDFLGSTNTLSRDRDRPSEYVIDFDQPIRRIEFYASVNQSVESDRNKGRVCIGNLSVITQRDHTFY